MDKLAKYNIKPQPCTENGVSFDSKLERRVARFLTACGFEWKREPQHFETWLPDFLVTVDGVEYLVEVKPSHSFFDLAKVEIALKKNYAVVLLPENPLSALTILWREERKTFRACLPQNTHDLWAETL